MRQLCRCGGNVPATGTPVADGRRGAAARKVSRLRAAKACEDDEDEEDEDEEGEDEENEDEEGEDDETTRTIAQSPPGSVMDKC